jgi:hypothetical protein
VTIKALFFGHLPARVSMVDGPIARPSGRTLAPTNIFGVLKIVVRPLMEVERASGARAFNVGSSNQ